MRVEVGRGVVEAAAAAGGAGAAGVGAGKETGGAAAAVGRRGKPAAPNGKVSSKDSGFIESNTMENMESEELETGMSGVENAADAGSFRENSCRNLSSPRPSPDSKSSKRNASSMVAKSRHNKMCGLGHSGSGGEAVRNVPPEQKTQSCCGGDENKASQ